MPLPKGDRLGPYEILAPIGKGGMGEVYSAHDPRTGRDVAIKVSAEQFNERFDREVRAVAALNHPNICTLFDVGPNYLVMEFIDGPTLAERIASGAIPVEEALKIAAQIANALEAAHEKGITHRDLKPANIKVKADGTVKVLDFGLAKQSRDSAGAMTENSPTLSMAATQAGVILGTAAYMGPEQASGKPVDKRADIWSFGVVLWEMLTGKRMFAGETVSHTLAAVLIKDPDWTQLPVDTPASVRRLLRRCLERDLKRRLLDIGSARLELEEVKVDEALATRTELRLQAKARATRWVWPGVAAALAILAGIAWWAPWRSTRPADKSLVRLDVDLGPEISLAPINVGGPRSFLPSIVISPDGRRLAYEASTAGGQPRLFIRRLDQPTATELPGTEGAIGPFFSSDGQWVGFFGGAKVNKISVEGGAVVPLAESPSGGAIWGQDGNIILGGAFNAGLTRIPSGGGARAKVTDLADEEIAQVHPQVLPGGKAVLFTAYKTLEGDKARIDVVTLAHGHRKTLVPGGTSPRYLATSSRAGHLVYTNKGTLFAIQFDPERLETYGTAVPILDDVAYDPSVGTAQFDVSGNGTLIYRRSGGELSPGMMTLQWLDATGKKEPLKAKPGAYGDPQLSPDGKRVAMLVSEGSSQDIWVYDQQRDAMTRLTSSGGPYRMSVWSPDGRYVFIGSSHGIFWTRADGAGQPQPFTQIKSFEVPWSITPDGKRLAYFEIPPQIWTVPLEETNGQMKAGKPEQFLKSQFQDSSPSFSPDGRWLAYVSNATESSEVYVRAFPPPASGQGGQWQISNSAVGQNGAMWSRTGHDLLYQSGDQIMAVSYTVQGDSFVADKPRVWLAKLGGAIAFGLAPDGKRVAVMTPVETPEAPKADHEVVLLFNFFDYLRERVPTRR